MKRIISIALALCLVFTLAACGNNTQTNDDSNSPVETSTEPKTVALCESWDFESGFFTPLNPGNSAGGYGISYYLVNMYETLVNVENGKIVPSLAKSWEVSADGLTYTFHLQEGVKFSDGSDLTAEVVKLNFDAIPVVMGQYNGSYGITGTLIDKTEALDEHTFVLHLTRPYYGALNDIAYIAPMGIMGSAAYNEDMSLSDAVKTASFGTGPYMYAGDYDGKKYTFVRNPYYHGDVPDADSFTVSVITDGSAAELALRSGEIDMLWGSHIVSFDAMSEFGKEGNFEAKMDEYIESVQYLAFNTTAAPFDDAVVRNAVAMAIDKESLCETVYNGLVSPTNRILPTYYAYCDIDAEGKSYDLDEAKRLLEEAGYVDSDGDGVREKDGQPLSVALPYVADNASTDNAMLFIADQLKALGITVNVSGMDMMTWFTTLMQGDWGLSFYHTYSPSYDPYTFMANMDADMQADPCAWQVSLVLPDGNSIFKELSTSTDETRIQEIYTYVLSEIYEQSIMVPLYDKYPPAIYNTERIASVDVNDSAYSVNVSRIKLK
ncbi:nickel ABC transporter substrate-binding protein [Ruthenibacterium lactatiformans]|uniref:Nickel ABC transporter substrate-binding protein n=1 Tax=Ruthenibacterium lactatiformans TaxID=1550024 RepID=A0A6I2U132_9FIRM|nr:ABC transporter substrate-binding protein [Ruthenibacterium lactatiformans]MST91377.1 nickel ABC transporter substrate-binding protein [Ruthenibacterium lactatiformans]